ncbi:Ankyrin repeat and SAM domain-containing protein 6 [Chamberlinius hualienensis]
MQAARNGHTSVVKRILSYKATVKHTSKMGATALLCATRSGHLSVVKLLLDEGADVIENPNDEVTPLMVAAQYGYDVIVTQLLEKGCNVNFRSKSAGLTALMLAAANNRVATVKLLLKMGADIEIVNAGNKTALDIVSLKRKKTVREILLQASEDAYTSDHRNSDSFTENGTLDATVMGDTIENDPDKTFHPSLNSEWLEAGQLGKSWWSNLMRRNPPERKCKKSNDYNKHEVPTLPGFKSLLSGAKSKSAECLNHIHQTSHLISPCRLSKVKQTLHVRLQSLFPSFEEDCTISMPPGKTSAKKQGDFRGSKLQRFVTVKDCLYEELKKFSLEDCYRMLVNEELDLESLTLLNEADVNKLDINTEEKTSLLHMIECLRIKSEMNHS